MKKFTWAGALMLPLVISSAQASVNIQTFSPAMGTSYVFVEDALMQVAPGDSTWTGERMYFHLLYNYEHDPLVEFDPTHSTRNTVLVNSFNTFDLGVGILPLKDLMLAIDLPINWVSFPSGGTQFGWGDMKLEAKYRVTPDDAPVAVALIPNLTVPTGDSTLFLSSGSVGVGMSLAVERDFGPFRASGNIGYRHNSNAIFQDVNYTNMIPMSLAVYIPINNQWGINVEGSGALSLPVNHYNNPGEFYAGGHYQITRDASVLLGASTGSVGGGGSGDFRVIAGVKFSPMDLLVAKKPEPKPVVTPAPAPAVRPVPKPAVRKPLVKPSPKPKPIPSKKPLPKKKPVKKAVKKPAAKKPKGKATPQAKDANGLTITTTTTTTTETKIHPGSKPKAPATPTMPQAPQMAPQAPTTNPIGNPQP